MSRGTVVSLARSRPIGTSRFVTGWYAGFGQTIDPFHANVSNRSHRACRRALQRTLELYGKRLAISADDRSRFLEAAREVSQLSTTDRWMQRVNVGHHDLMFWLLDETEAELRGVRPKR